MTYCFPQPYVSGCDGIVVGLPVSSAGALHRRASDSAQGRRCRNFAETVAAFAVKHGVVVMLADETGTSVRAEALMSDIGGRRTHARGKKDSVAAALILDTYFGAPEKAVRVRPPRLG
jgi:putative transcription antitermination factor YqgF